MTEIMVDLETLGACNNAAIISIGAVCFDPASSAIKDEFYVTVDPQSCVDAGLVIEAKTVMWWMQQSYDARKAFKSGEALSLGNALIAFMQWLERQGKSIHMWGNGAMFDNVILVNAFKAANLKQPWSYIGDRCYRTMKTLFKDVKPLPRVDNVHHNALDDAKWQALHLMKILREKGINV